jgi:hypothetical protein
MPSMLSVTLRGRGRARRRDREIAAEQRGPRRATAPPEVAGTAVACQDGQPRNARDHAGYGQWVGMGRDQPGPARRGPRDRRLLSLTLGQPGRQPRGGCLPQVVFCLGQDAAGLWGAQAGAHTMLAAAACHVPDSAAPRFMCEALKPATTPKPTVRFVTDITPPAYRDLANRITRPGDPGGRASRCGVAGYAMKQPAYGLAALFAGSGGRSLVRIVIVRILRVHSGNMCQWLGRSEGEPWPRRSQWRTGLNVRCWIICATLTRRGLRGSPRSFSSSCTGHCISASANESRSTSIPKSRKARRSPPVSS